MCIQSRAELAGLSEMTKNEVEAWFRNVLQVMVGGDERAFHSPILAEIEQMRWRVAQNKLKELREMFGVEVLR